MVTVENGMNWTAYLEDSVWPSAALKKLCGQPEVTSEDLRKGFEANYGARVRARAIVLNNMRKAQEVWEMARTNPTIDEFGKLAEQYSIEASSRALKGQVPPIQRHGSQPKIEEEAYKLKPGEISGIIGVGAETYIILFCEGYTEPQKVSFEEVRQSLHDDVFEKKQRIAMAQAFEALKDVPESTTFWPGRCKRPIARLTTRPRLIRPCNPTHVRASNSVIKSELKCFQPRQICRGFFLRGFNQTF